MSLEGTTDFYLKQGTALRLIYEKAEPLLWATRFIQPVPEETDAFLYRYDSTGMASDAKIKKPAHARIGGDFPELNISRPTWSSAMTEARGFQIRIPHKTIRNAPRGVDEIQRAYKTAGYWLAKFVCDDILTVVKAGATTPTWTPAAVWSAAGATPVDDLIALEEQMDREGYPYSLTDVPIHKTNWFEMKRYLTSVDVDGTKQRDIYGVPSIGRDVMHIPVIDADIIKCQSGMTEGSILGLDRMNPAAEYHYYNDPKFSTPQVSYETVIDGVKKMVTADNLGFFFDTWVEKGSEDTILKFGVESKCVVTEAYAALYDTGI